MIYCFKIQFIGTMQCAVKNSENCFHIVETPTKIQYNLVVIHDPGKCFFQKPFRNHLEEDQSESLVKPSVSVVYRNISEIKRPSCQHILERAFLLISETY